MPPDQHMVAMAHIAILITSLATLLTSVGGVIALFRKHDKHIEQIRIILNGGLKDSMKAAAEAALNEIIKENR